jgi:hypothetical protein
MILTAGHRSRVFALISQAASVSITYYRPAPALQIAALVATLQSARGAKPSAFQAISEQRSRNVRNPDCGTRSKHARYVPPDTT